MSRPKRFFFGLKLPQTRERSPVGTFDGDSARQRSIENAIPSLMFAMPWWCLLFTFVVVLFMVVMAPLVMVINDDGIGVIRHCWFIRINVYSCFYGI